jgi:hypothetical protein
MNGNGRAETGEIIVGDDNHTIYNNITVPRTGRLGLAMKYGVGNTFEYNLVRGGNWLFTWPENLYYINADPMLVNPGAGDFHLSASSPAIDSGDNSNAASTDADGNSRPQDGSGLGYAMVDLGAYEYTGGGSAPTDDDSDGIPNELDNCVDVPNGPLILDAGGNSQLDTDGDGYGNLCDADLNQDGITNGLDIGLFRTAQGTNDPVADFNGDGVVNGLDIGTFRAESGTPPGPSCCTP